MDSFGSITKLDMTPEQIKQFLLSQRMIQKYMPSEPYEPNMIIKSYSNIIKDLNTDSRSGPIMKNDEDTQCSKKILQKTKPYVQISFV